MKTLKDHSSALVSAVIELIVGILLLLNPVGFTSAIIVGLGVLLISSGLVSIIKYVMAKPEEASKSQGLTKGLVLCIVGGLCALFADSFVAVFPLLSMLYGVLLLIMSAAKIQVAVDMVRLKRNNWTYAAISAGLSLALALMMLFNPFETTAIVYMILSICLIAEAVLDVLAVFMKKKAS